MGDRRLALLRGINVGGKHSVSMAALAGLFVELGCLNVRTYIQSGNVLFMPPPDINAKQIQHALEKHLGFAVPVVLRSHAAMAKVVAANPFAAPSADARFLHVVFLAEPLSVAQTTFLRSQIHGDEQLVEHATELYLSLPYGGGRSKLASACIARKLPPSNTMRNWPTVLKLAEMLAV